MFVEKLKQKDVKCFEFYGFTPSKIKKTDNGYFIQLNAGIGDYQFYVSDFSVMGANLISEEETYYFEQEWRYFLANKFGAKYSKALNTFIQDKDFQA